MSSNHGEIRIFNGAVAIITGGASGLGRGFGENLAARGCEVVLADVQIDLAEEVAQGIRASGGKATAVALDVTDAKAVKKVVEETAERCGRLDFMFNNAGIVIFGEPDAYEISDWNKSIDINFKGVVHGAHAAFRVMKKQGFGHIINTSSVAGLSPWPMHVGYTSTKAAVLFLSLALRAECDYAGVRVSVLCPGPVQPPMLDDAGKFGRWIGDYPLERRNKLMQGIKPIPLDKFMDKAIKQIADNKAIIVIPGMWKVLWYAYRLTPHAGVWFCKTMVTRMREILNKK